MSLIPPATTRLEGTAAVPRRAERSGLRAPLLWTARLLLGLVLTAWTLLLIAWLTLHWAILPHIQEWRVPIQERAASALGVAVRIGSIEVRSTGWVPSLSLRDVTLFDADGRVALQLPHVFAAVSARSLLSLEPRFEQLLIDGPQLEVRRDAAGRIFVAGLDVGGGPDSAGDSAAANWFFAQHEFVIRGGALRWTDEQRGAAPLALTDVRLVVRNGLRHHDLRLDATPPADWGERFHAVGRFTQPLLAPRGDWRRWSGAAYAELPRADLRELRRYVTLPFELHAGIGALRGWGELKDGRATAFTLDLALRTLALRLADDVDVLDASAVEGRLAGARDAGATTLTARNFGFVTADGLRWPSGDLTLTWRDAAGAVPAGGEFGAQRLDLALVAQIAERIPLGAPLRRLLAGLDPRGVATDLALRWDGPPDAPQHYRAQGRIDGLALAARAASAPDELGRPGLSGATVEFDATESGGRARVALDGGAIDVPGVFADPRVGFDRLGARLQWRIDAPAAPGRPRHVAVEVDDARFANADAEGALTARWTSDDGAAPHPPSASASPPRPSSTSPSRKRSAPASAAAPALLTSTSSPAGPGRLELDGALVRGAADRVFRYLPLALPKDTRDYVQHAVRGGRLTGTTFHVRGPLRGFPFYRERTAKVGDGEFRVATTVDDARFAIAGEAVPAGTPPAPPRWPTLDQVGVELVLDRATLELRDGRARLGDVEWSGVNGAIRDLGGDPVLALQARARGPLDAMLRGVAQTPVGGWIGNALATSSATGPADLALELGLPLARLDASTAKGSLTLAGNDLRITPDSPLLGAAKGRVDFTEKGFTVVGATARLYGGDVRFDGGSQRDGGVRFSGQGTIGADGLRRADAAGALGAVAASLSGQASYRASLGFVQGHPELLVTSDLVGLASTLPAPLQKAAETPLELRVQTRIDPASTAPGQALRDTLQVGLGRVVQASFDRDLSGAQPRVLRGGVGVLGAAPQPAAGVAANIQLPTLATDAWEPIAARLGGADGASAGGAAAPSGYLPDSIGLAVGELVVGSRRLTHVSAGLSQSDGVWRANVDADQLNGYVEYRVPSRRGGASTAGGRVYARLARLSLPKSDVEQVETLLDQQPSSVPALDIVVEDFELRGKHLGRVEVEAINRTAAAGRDWHLTKFELTTPEARLTATGHWAAVGAADARGRADAGARRAVMDFKLALSDSGAWLTRLGTRDAIRGGKGQLSGQIAWLGSPFALDYPSLAGQINVALDAGQFLKAEPGAARLLGVLSLQSLPRRLSLDFRDLFQEGFAFDSVTGDVSIEQGVARTNNLRMRGVQALVLMEGSADLEHETQDLRVVVVPEINAGTAALAYAVINPVVGLSAFLAQALLRKPLMQAGTREFHVSGPWDDPKVERVERRLGDDRPVPAAPAQAPAKNE